MSTNFISKVVTLSCLIFFGQAKAINFSRSEAKRICQEMKENQIQQTKQCHQEVSINENVILELTKNYQTVFEKLRELQKENLKYLEYNSHSQGEYLDLLDSKKEITNQLIILDENIRSTYDYYNKLIEGISPNFSNRYVTQALENYSKEKDKRTTRLENERDILQDRLLVIKRRISELNIELAPFRNLIAKYDNHVKQLKGQTEAIIKTLSKANTSTGAHDNTLGISGNFLFNFGHGESFDLHACISMHMSLNNLPTNKFPRLPGLPRDPWSPKM